MKVNLHLDIPPPINCPRASWSDSLFSVTQPPRVTRVTSGSSSVYVQHSRLNHYEVWSRIHVIHVLRILTNILLLTTVSFFLDLSSQDDFDLTSPNWVWGLGLGSRMFNARELPLHREVSVQLNLPRTFPYLLSR